MSGPITSVLMARSYLFAASRNGQLILEKEKKTGGILLDLDHVWFLWGVNICVNLNWNQNNNDFKKVYNKKN